LGFSPSSDSIAIISSRTKLWCAAIILANTPAFFVCATGVVLSYPRIQSKKRVASLDVYFMISASIDITPSEENFAVEGTTIISVSIEIAADKVVLARFAAVSKS